MQTAARARAVVRRDDLDRKFADELDAHLAMLTDDYVRRGMSPEEARRVAVIRIGAPVSLKEQHRAPAPERLDQGPTGDTVAQDKSAILQGTLDLMVLKTRLEENLRSFLWDVNRNDPASGQASGSGLPLKTWMSTPRSRSVEGTPPGCR
jgi:hypothetical protein